MVDAQASGVCTARREGSSPFLRTTNFISLNFLLTKTKFFKNCVLFFLHQKFFFSKDFVFLSNQLAKIYVVTAKEYGVKDFRCCSSPLKDSFVFFNRSEDIVGTKNTIPANSYVYCSFESLKVFDRIERLEAANDKVALVKLGEGAPLLRQVIFDSNHLILRAWNDKVSDMIFPISKGSIGVYGSRDYVSMANGELIYAEGVEIYGIAYEYAKTIDISR